MNGREQDATTSVTPPGDPDPVADVESEAPKRKFRFPMAFTVLLRVWIASSS